ncbi:MAG: hypothetical protein EXS13_05365 [Planctomycetes bacterium]|nr:hypothetical protein [Planctomycetota bacterium]
MVARRHSIERNGRARTRACRAVARRPGVALVAVLGVFLVATQFACSERDTASGGSGTAPVHRPLILLGVDGLEWDLLLRFMDEGALPNIAALARDGFAAELATLDNTISPVIWTTVVTGKLPQEHGITQFSYLDEQHQPHLLLSMHRASKALWNLYDEAGLSSEVIGWWCTFPVEEIRGGMVAQTSTRAQVAIENGAVIWKGTNLHGLPYQTWPEARQERMDAHAEELVAAVKDGRDPCVQRFGPPPPLERKLPSQLYTALRTGHYADLLFRAAAFDTLDGATLDAAALDTAAQPGAALPDALLLYLGTVDVASHMFWRYFEPQAFEDRPSEADIARFGDVIKEAYRFVDETVGELRRRAPAADLLLMSDHGFHAVAMKAKFDDAKTDRADSGNHQDAPPGVLLAIGPSFRKQPLKPGAANGDVMRGDVKRVGGVEDILPTLLVRVGLPYALDFAGRPLLNLLTPESIVKLPIRSLPTYDDPVWRGRRAALLRKIPEFERHFEQALQSLDGANLELLRALGYTGDGLQPEVPPKSPQSSESPQSPHSQQVPQSRPPPEQDGRR